MSIRWTFASPIHARRRTSTETSRDRRGAAGRVIVASLWFGAIVFATACAGRPFAPVGLDATDVRARSVVRESGGLRVVAGVPDRSETEALFGAPLYDRGIQPVWLEVVNGGDVDLAFAPVSVDRDYFSPLEVAYMHRGAFASSARSAMERACRDSALPRSIPAGQTRSGFVFTHVAPGTKAFNVEFFGDDARHHVFTFFVDVPGFTPDHADLASTRSDRDHIVAAEDPDALRSALAALPCCTALAAGQGIGPALNVAVVGTARDVQRALLRARWAETDRAAMPGREPPPWQGRPPDAVFRKTRAADGDRNELRLWRAPVRVGDRDVWVGEVMHFLGPIGGGEAGRHSVRDPDADDARFSFVQDLWYSQALVQHAWQDAGAEVTFEQQHVDEAGALYFTDGYRAVVWLSPEPVSLVDVRYVEWDEVPSR